MSLEVLFRDEFQGLYRSKAMLALLVGLPVLVMILYWASPDTSGMPMSAFTALVASSLAGALAAVMVAVGMMNEKSRKVYDLFLVRPVKAAHIILAKFGATFLFVTLAVLVSIGVGMVADIDRIAGFPPPLLADPLHHPFHRLSVLFTGAEVPCFAETRPFLA